MIKLFIAGHNGMVGSALLNLFKKDQEYEIITEDRKNLDLLDSKQTNLFFEKNKPDYVILAAAKVGGIVANSKYPVEFLIDNLKIQNNVIESCNNFNVKKLLFLGSSCIYPKNLPQPLRENDILSSYLEQTNEAYSIAKITGYKLCSYYKKQYGRNFFTVMPSNLYGPNDNYHPQNAHALPMLIDRIHKAKMNGSKKVVVWGTGEPKREYMYSEDLAQACKLLIEKKELDQDIFNVGSGYEISIKDLAELIKKVIGFDGDLYYDQSYPDGVMRKILDSTRLNNLIDWEFRTSMEEGIRKTYEDYIQRKENRK